MGSLRPSNKERRLRKVAIGSNSLEVEVHVGRKLQSRRSKVARSKCDRKHCDLEVY